MHQHTAHMPSLCEEYCDVDRDRTPRIATKAKFVWADGSRSCGPCWHLECPSGDNGNGLGIARKTKSKHRYLDGLAYELPVGTFETLGIELREETTRSRPDYLGNDALGFWRPNATKGVALWVLGSTEALALAGCQVCSW